MATRKLDRMTVSLDWLLQLVGDGDAYVRLRAILNERPTEPEEILAESRIWMPDVRSQDDIYEGAPPFRWSNAPASRHNVEALARRVNAGAADEEIGRLVELVMGRLANPAVLANIRSGIEQQMADLYRSSSILSFFKDPSVQAHWAHYANRGRGYGLVFDFSHPWMIELSHELEPSPAVPFPVEYVPPNARPSIELDFRPSDLNSFDDLKAGLLTKSNHWQEQREERLIRVGVPAGHVSFPPQSLKAIILGYNLSEDEKNLLTLKARQREDPLLVVEVVPSPTGFSLDLIQR